MWLKNGTPHTIAVSVPAPGALAPMHSHDGRAEGGRHLLQWGSGPGAPEKKWNCRHKFLLSGALSSRTLTPAEVQNTTYFHSGLSYMHTAWGNTKNGTGGVRLVGWGLTALLTQNRSYRAFIGHALCCWKYWTTQQKQSNNCVKSPKINTSASQHDDTSTTTHRCKIDWLSRV